MLSLLSIHSGKGNKCFNPLPTGRPTEDGLGTLVLFVITAVFVCGLDLEVSCVSPIAPVLYFIGCPISTDFSV